MQLRVTSKRKKNLKKSRRHCSAICCMHVEHRWADMSLAGAQDKLLLKCSQSSHATCAEDQQLVAALELGKVETCPNLMHRFVELAAAVCGESKSVLQ